MTYVFIILLFCYKINFGHQYCVLRNYFTHEGTSQNENNRMKEATKKKNFILIASFRHQSYVIIRQYRFLQKKITRTFKKKTSNARLRTHSTLSRGSAISGPLANVRT